MPTKETAQKWTKEIEKSEGKLRFVPEKHKQELEIVAEMEKNFQDEIRKIAKLEIDMRIRQENLLYAIRQDLYEKGEDDIWTKDIGLVKEAIRDGVFVYHVVNSGQRQ